MKVYIYEKDGNKRDWELVGDVTRLDITKDEKGFTLAPVVDLGSLLIIHETDWNRDTGWMYSDISNNDSINVLVISGNSSGAVGDGSSNGKKYHAYKRPVSRILQSEKLFIELLKQFISRLRSDPKFNENPDWTSLYLKSFANLSSLAILCQGYLIAHADSQLDLPKQALNCMGWDKIEETKRNELFKTVRSKIQDDRNVTEMPKWWKAVLSEDDSSIVRKLEEEYGAKLPDDLSNLVDAIYKNFIETDLVAKAFMSLTEKLKG